MVAARRPMVETLSTPTAALRVPVLSFWEGGHMVELFGYEISRVDGDVKDGER